jgi:hypothetical protein
LVSLAVLMASMLAASGYFQYSSVTQRNIMSAQKTGYGIRFYQSAAKVYRKTNGTWPADLAALRPTYVPANYPEDNPWGNQYTGRVDGNDFAVTVEIPENYIQAAAKLLPSVTISGTSLTSSVPPPGSEPRFERYLHKSGDSNLRTMEDNLIMGDNRITNLADGVDGKDAINLRQAGERFVPVTGGTMTGTLDTPGLTVSRFTDADDPSFFHNPDGDGGQQSYLNQLVTYDVYLEIPTIDNWASQAADLNRPGTWNCVAVPLTMNGCGPAGSVCIGLTGDMSSTDFPYPTSENCWANQGSAICCSPRS